MTTIRRSLAALASPSTAAGARCFACALLCCGFAVSAHAMTTRVHRVAAPSEKAAPVLQQSASARSRPREGAQGKKPQGRHGAVPPSRDRAAAKPGDSHRKKAKPREPEPVDDPIVVRRAAKGVPAPNKGAHKAAPRAEVAEQKPAPATTPHAIRSARERRDAHLQPPVPASPPAVPDAATGGESVSNKLTVDDFVRAAGAPGMDAPASPEQAAVPATSEATPEAMSKVEVATEGAHVSASTPTAVHKPVQKTAVVQQKLTPASAQPPANAAQKPAPIVRRAPAVVAVVEPADEPVPAPVQTVEGFGAEVDLLAPQPATKSTSPTKHAAAGQDNAPTAEARAKITDDAMLPMAAPLYTRAGKLVMPLPLKGTREILMHQNQMADDAGLTRIQHHDDLNRMRAQHLLAAFPEMAGLEVNEDLPANRRYARPWTVKFVSDIAKAYYTRFHEPLRLNSAVRTVEYQLRLQRVNGNAAAVEGETASPHLTGQAIDFGKHGMSIAEIAWMRSMLLPLMQAGKIDVEEEFQQACFHISVYAAYAPKKRVAPKTELAQLHAE